MIKLRDIDAKNFWEVIKLTVADNQRGFVATNTLSIAQSKVQPECIPLAVYEDETLVGFVMYCMDTTDNEYWVYRVMTDSKYQSKGYGRKAMEQLISLVQDDKEHHVIYISFEPENEWAKALYENMGFVPAGRLIDNEVVYKLEY